MNVSAVVPKVVVITGGASGMGKIYAKRMAKQGNKVAVLDLNAISLADMADHSRHIHTYPCDVADQSDVESVLNQVVNDLGNIDRLVHCAAIMPTGKLADQETNTIHKLMTINYGGTVNVTKAVLPTMLDRRQGEIVIFGSTGGTVPVPDCGAYCASKAATNAFVEILLEENRGSGVQFMLVCPPLVDTPLLQQAIDSSNPKAIRDSITRKRFADPEFIIDEVEKGLKKGTEILLPGKEAKSVTRFRRFAPRLLWKIIHRANREAAVGKYSPS